MSKRKLAEIATQAFVEKTKNFNENDYKTIVAQLEKAAEQGSFSYGFRMCEFRPFSLGQNMYIAQSVLDRIFQDYGAKCTIVDKGDEDQADNWYYFDWHDDDNDKDKKDKAEKPSSHTKNSLVYVDYENSEDLYWLICANCGERFNDQYVLRDHLKKHCL